MLWFPPVFPGSRHGQKGAAKGHSKHTRGCCRAGRNGAVSCQLPVAHPRSRDPSSRDPGHRGSVHRLLPVPSSREKEVIKFIPTASRDDSLSVCLNSRLQTLSSITLPCRLPLLWKAEGITHQLPSTFCWTAILKFTPGDTKDGAGSSRNLIPSAVGHVGQGNLQSLLPTQA